MERFGGCGRERDLGLILFQVMGAMDFVQVDNVEAASRFKPCSVVDPAGRSTIVDLLQPPPGLSDQVTGFHPIGGSKMGHSSTGLCEGARPNQPQKAGADGTDFQAGQHWRCRSKGKAFFPKKRGKGTGEEEDHSSRQRPRRSEFM